MHPDQEEFLGIDVGSARIGLARGSSQARLAEPLQTMPAKGAIEMIANITQQQAVRALVVGLPRNLDGRETPQTKSVKQWVELAKLKISLPFYYQDEALTSEIAAARGVKNQTVDANAAALILQDFLDSPIEDRVRA